MKKSLLTGFVTILIALLIGGCGSTQNITANVENVAPSNAVMENVTNVSYSYPGNSSENFQIITDEGENTHDDGSGYGFLFDSNVLTKIDANSGNVLVSIDNGNTWLTIKEYEEQYPDYPDIAYNNAEEFQEWINEQTEKVQNGYWENKGEKGWSW